MRNFFLSAVCILCILPFLTSCGFQKKIKIGLITSLTGRYADMALHSRYGASLAVEELQQEHSTFSWELIIKDDGGDPDCSVQCAHELADEGVKYIVGPLVTGAATKVVPEINRLKILTVGATIAGENLAGADDYFIKLYPSTADMAKRLARYAVNTKGIKTFAVIYDAGNKEYSELWYKNFKNEVLRNGGSIYNPVIYRAGTDVKYSELAVKALYEGASGVFICASGLDSALLCQQLKKRTHAEIFLSSWASSNELITSGGRSMEGIMMCEPFDRSSSVPSYTLFEKKFTERFNSVPNYGAVFHYEAVHLLADAAVKAGTDPDKMKKKIVNAGFFEGLQGRVTVNVFGDVHRDLYLYTVRKGNFVKLQ